MYTLFAITGLKKIVPIPLLLEIPHYTGILVVLMKILVFRGIPDNRGNWIHLVNCHSNGFLNYHDFNYRRTFLWHGHPNNRGPTV